MLRALKIYTLAMGLTGALSVAALVYLLDDPVAAGLPSPEILAVLIKLSVATLLMFAAYVFADVLRIARFALGLGFLFSILSGSLSVAVLFVIAALIALNVKEHSV
jgi:hypothetical protein